ncbi:bifunctional glutamate N-acetyltransferase/amino-acid acetyltransferase ArgJ [Thalassoglobus polymorphus]|uniref:Arginine biosynthesis bifunctional protein ArgJ n=1 Tax=Thalassoglobus polymorphus TaxID=2527994 RepID=A0A517QLW2_9PLAN|nr:bifunctional glutamate N-acetyltransferase/amino-acid acetyltransferase ArgJ [Thalassoglobus polymorphus]QDT32620.1 Arginine biosynthesis bifunctional protein ArgJ [Thalassoglobus polymorphus]
MAAKQHTLPQGFQTTGVTCGIKDSGLPDLSLFTSDTPATSVGVFTQNQVVGAPVIVSRGRVPSPSVRGIIINSGNANACTGEQGLTDAQRMTAILAEQFTCDESDVLVCSTGVIGHFLPMPVIENGIRDAFKQLGKSSEDLTKAAKSIMTTDTVEKISSKQIEIDGTLITVTGVAKGAAMIAPNMATMLSVIMTDCQLETSLADSMLKQAVNQSFNCISVEGHTSTSDTVLLMANGATGQGCASEQLQQALQSALNEVCSDLAQQIIRDAEGAEHFVRVEVSGLENEDDARRIAKVVCESPLVKTAVTGNDPNWGRIVSAAGYAGVPFQEQDLSLRLNDVVIYEWGSPTSFDESALSKSMATGEIKIQLEFRLGNEKMTYWTCDLTSEYIRLNADYTT